MSTATPTATMSRYAILGCGSVGHAVAEELVDEGKDVRILDVDESRVEALRDQDLDAHTADISDPSIVADLEDCDVVLILSSDVEANKAAVRNIRDRAEDLFLVVRASDPVSADELTELGVDIVINPSAVIAESALRGLEKGELEHKVNQLAMVLDGAEDLAILAHRSPDPDSIASAVALQAIARSRGLEADIVYEGEIGHQENRAFVNLLGLELLSREEVELDQYDLVALLDYANAAEAEADVPVDILIDHIEPETTIEASFVDVRPNVSSTSTILTKYIQEFDVTVSEEVATALLYGIRAETLDFKRDTTPADLTAAAYLYPFASHDILEQVESPSMSPETLDVLSDAISNREVKGSHLISHAGFVRDRDALSQAAQHLLDLEGITTSAVFGIADESIYLAARSKDIRMNIGDVLEAAFGEMGDIAGHATDAAVEIPLGLFTAVDTSEDHRDVLLELVEESVRTELFAAMGVESGSGEGGNGS